MTIESDWKRQSYLHYHDFFSPEKISRLNAICDRIHAQYREYSRREIEPNNYGFCEQGWVQLHLNHPKYHQESRADLSLLLDTVADSAITDILSTIFGQKAIFSQMNLYYHPQKDITGKWHRDCQFFLDEIDDEKEKELVFSQSEPSQVCHVHIPLVENIGTKIIPGSHSRFDTPEELAIRRNDPSAPLTHEKEVHLRPGDFFTFHVNAIHRGIYDHTAPRKTIAITYTTSDYQSIEVNPQNIKKSEGYIAQFQPWFNSESYLANTQPETQNFFNAFKSRYASEWTPENLSLLDSKRRSYFEVHTGL